MKRLVALVVAAALLLPGSAGGSASFDEARVDDLAALGKVWLAVRFQHPRVALTERNWDAVLETAVPAVLSARDHETAVAAVGAMLASLNDPATRLETRVPERTGSAASPVPPVMNALPGGGYLIDVRAPGALARAGVMRKAITDHMDAITAADRLVVDVRGTRASGEEGGDILSILDDVIAGEPTPVPAPRYVRHSGFRSQLGGVSFYTSAQVTEGITIQRPRTGIGARRVAFVVDESAIVTPLMLGLRARGTGAIATVGPLPRAPVGRTAIPLGGERLAYVRTTDYVLDGKRVEPGADASLAPGSDDATVYARAAALIASARPPVAGVADPAPVWLPDRDYANEPFPSQAHRLLAVYRLWGVLDAFCPYKDLMDKPWSEALPSGIRAVLAATTPLEYAEAIARTAALTNDSHVNVIGSAALDGLVGLVRPPVLVRFVEGRPVITRVLDAQAAPALERGDEVLAIDGHPVAERIQRIAGFISYSTPAGRDRVVEQWLLAGNPSSTAVVTVRGADGAARDVKIARPARAAPATQRDGDVVRILDGNIGYADLERLEVADVPAMFERFRNTAGIIFDMRGYPRGTAWAIAPRINVHADAAHPTLAARFTRPTLSPAPDAERITFVQDLPQTETWVYDKPTVMLIDERAISQSEHTGLFFKAANGTTFVGSGTTGANGDVTVMVLPGGLRVTFTGHEVRWPDGRQLQRIGLVPDVVVTPTIAGIRAGKDEVLDRAVVVILDKARGSR